MQNKYACEQNKQKMNQQKSTNHQNNGLFIFQ